MNTVWQFLNIAITWMILVESSTISGFGDLFFRRIRRGTKDQDRSGRLIYPKRFPSDYQDICGKPVIDFSPKVATFRIINGTCSPYGSLPWVVQIQVKQSNGKYVHHCGGTIITEDFVLTAAHCLLTVQNGYIRIVVGQNDLNQIDDAERAFDVADSIIHSDWDSPKIGKYSNDIALIKIRRKGDGRGFTFSNNVLPACLPDNNDASSGRECIVSGWGNTRVLGKIQEDCLRSAIVPLIDENDCKEMYRSSGRTISQGMLCAGFESGGVDSCKGDSGGPLVCIDKNRYQLFGIVSWGQGCGQKRKPGVYADVREYVEWINANIAYL